MVSADTALAILALLGLLARIMAAVLPANVPWVPAFAGTTIGTTGYNFISCPNTNLGPGLRRDDDWNGKAQMRQAGLLSWASLG